MEDRPQSRQLIENTPENIEYEERYVAYLDILGFSEMVSDDRPEATIALLDRLLKWAPDQLSEFFEEDGLTYRLFSDCVCASVPATNRGLKSLLKFVGLFQLHAALQGIFVRGGLSVDKHYETERMIFSKGLVNAYELENKALYPRVIVQEQVVERIREIILDDSKHYSIYAYVKCAPDGLVFVDYIEAMSFDPYDYEDLLRGHKQQILKQLRDNQPNPKTVAKYIWLADYHNYKCNRFLEIASECGASENINKEVLIASSELPEFSGIDIE